MSARTIINQEKPQTQTVDAIKALLSWRGRASDPLPSFLEMGEGDNRLVLVLSNKKDSYYTTTARDCSCPAHNWHPGQRCKHQRAHFPETATIQKQTMAETLEQAEANLHKMPYQYQRMVKAAREAAAVDSDSIMPRAPFRPLLEDDGKPTGTAKVSSPLYVDCLPDPAARDIAYHSIQEDKALWPVEA